MLRSTPQRAPGSTRGPARSPATPGQPGPLEREQSGHPWNAGAGASVSGAASRARGTRRRRAAHTPLEKGASALRVQRDSSASFAPTVRAPPRHGQRHELRIPRQSPELRVPEPQHSANGPSSSRNASRHSPAETVPTLSLSLPIARPAASALSHVAARGARLERRRQRGAAPAKFAPAANKWPDDDFNAPLSYS